MTTNASDLHYTDSAVPHRTIDCAPERCGQGPRIVVTPSPYMRAVVLAAAGLSAGLSPELAELRDLADTAESLAASMADRATELRAELEAARLRLEQMESAAEDYEADARDKRQQYITGLRDAGLVITADGVRPAPVTLGREMPRDYGQPNAQVTQWGPGK
jgi:hypothetical protein